MRPVHILQIQPERKLIKRERSAHAIQDREQPAQENGCCRVAGSNLSQCAIAHNEEEQNSPNQVVDMSSIKQHPTERPNMMRDGHDQKAYTDKGNEEAHGSQEKLSSWPIRDTLMNQSAYLGKVQKQQHGCRR